MLSRILGASQFDQQVLNISLINICNQESYVGQEMRQRFNAWSEDADEPTQNPWLHLHQLTVYVPHPNQLYEEITLEQGLTQGYNIEVKLIEDPSQLPYKIPEGGHFVVVMKQKSLNGNFEIAATGIFVRPLAALYLDIIVDLDQAEYQPIVVKHPIIREYPTGWEDQLKQFLIQEIRSEDLPNLIQYVDQSFNQDYRSPSWDDISRMTSRFIGV